MVNLSNDFVTRSIINKSPICVLSIWTTKFENKSVDGSILILIDQFNFELRIVGQLLIQNYYELLQNIYRIITIDVVALVRLVTTTVATTITTTIATSITNCYVTSSSTL